MKLTKLLILFCALICASCECPLKEEMKRNANNNGFYAERLLGIWQCSYNMSVGGVDFKEIKFMSNGKADIIMAQPYDTEWYTETFNYAYYGNTLRFSKGRTNFQFTIKDWLFPELTLCDSFGTYVITLRRVFAEQ